jgi:UDP-2,4-diacetamido-2,4,6-trideoxy-beta-L-altropyranose hydrolase
MQIAFRTDASLQMGSGHVMRCLALADALRSQGAKCHFICRAHHGHLIAIIRQRGYVVSNLAAPLQNPHAVTKNSLTSPQDLQPYQLHQPGYAAWLGSAWQTDAHETAAVLASLQTDWLVVDHYALDQRWEVALAAHCRKLLVIDDLADRPHHCNLLLDQNLGREPQDYTALVPTHCQVLTGPQYALLRPEFAALRPYSLRRRQVQPSLRQLLITMGGVDQSNATLQVLQALKTCSLPAECCIAVVMGLTAPWVQSVREMSVQMPWPTEVVVNANDMAQRMADSDLAIGAAGGTSWERCCLGLPSLMVVLAQNQQSGARALDAAHAARLLGYTSDIDAQLPLAVRELGDYEYRMSISRDASAITDGQGVEKILKTMEAVSA